MRSSLASTERRDLLARGLAALLLVLAVVSLTAAWALRDRAESHQAALRGDNPADEVLVPDVPTRTDPSGSAPASAPAPVDRSIEPAHLFVESIGVDTSIAAAPTRMTHDPFVGKTVASFGVPNDMYTTTWWSSGPKPGSGSMAVILGHTQVGGYGVFNKLGALRDGATITVAGAAGQALRFHVIAVRTGISKTDPYALRKALAAHPTEAALALITCSGTFDSDYDQSTENTVAFARLTPAPSASYGPV